MAARREELRRPPAASETDAATPCLFLFRVISWFIRWVVDAGNEIPAYSHAMKLIGQWLPVVQQFNGIDDCLVIPDAPKLGTQAFTISADVKLATRLTTAYGEVISQFDTRRRKGFSIRIGGSAPGYSSVSDVRSVFASIDDARLGKW